MYEFRISITGDKIEVSALKDAISELLKLLKSVEGRVAGGQSVRWRLATLSYNSPIIIGCTGEPRSRKRNAPDCARLVGSTALSGLADLERGLRPSAFSDDALEVSKRLAALRGKRGVGDVFVMEANGVAPEPLALSTRTVATVDDFIGVKSEALGSVEGRLEVVSAHGGITCNIYEALSGKVVRCEVPDDKKRAVLDAFEQRVMATGTVKRDASGQARGIVLRELVVLPEHGEFISLAGMAPDFTGGLESAAYVKSRWE